MAPFFLIACTGLLLAMAAISTDSLLPTLPWMANDLGLDIALIQQVVPAFMFGYGFGQLTFGPISDRIGRRPALAIGMAVYLVGTVLCLFSDSFALLIVGRIVQGVGGGAGQTVARAMMRDCYSGPALAQNMALATAFFAVGPILAPIAGAWLAEAGDWHWVFLAMAGFAGLMLLLIYRLSESLPEPDPRALDPVRLLRNALQVVAHSQSRFFLLLAGFSFSGIVMMLAGMPRLFGENFGIEGRSFAYLFAIGGFGIIIGQFINRTVISRFGTIWSIGAGALLVATRIPHGLDPRRNGPIDPGLAGWRDVRLQSRLSVDLLQCHNPGDRSARRYRWFCSFARRIERIAARLDPCRLCHRSHRSVTLALGSGRILRCRRRFRRHCMAT